MSYCKILNVSSFFQGGKFMQSQFGNPSNVHFILKNEGTFSECSNAERFIILRVPILIYNMDSMYINWAY
jgi:hypothetical protein